MNTVNFDSAHIVFTKDFFELKICFKKLNKNRDQKFISVFKFIAIINILLAFLSY